MQSHANLVRILALFVGVFLLSSLAVRGQAAAQVLGPGETQTGTLLADDVADVYVYEASIGQVLTVTASSTDVPITLLLTDPTGALVAQAVSDAAGNTSINELELALSGRYQVTVFVSASGVQSNGSYLIRLDITGSAAQPPTQAPVSTGTTATTPAATTDPATIPDFVEPVEILITEGIRVSLNWTTRANLNLEVRDPFGNTLFFNQRQSPINGQFGFDANGLCEIVTDQSQETATWPSGFLPTGSYEILVYNEQDCDGLGREVPFTVNVTVGGNALEPITGSIAPPPNDTTDNVFLTSFTVNEDQTATVNNAGLYPDTAINQLPVPFSQLITNTLPLTVGAPNNGAVTNEQEYVTYSFEASEGDFVTVNMSAISGNLDTLAQIVTPQGSILAVNDDAGGTTDSTIDGARIPETGTYYLIATRYGKDIGGTQGDYQLFLTRSTATLPNEVASLNLPDGEVEVYLTWQTQADLQLLVRGPAGDAVYDDVPTVPSGGTLAVAGNVNCEQAEGDPVSYIYWPLGFLRPGFYETEVWYQNNCGDTRPVEFTLTTIVDGEVISVERRFPSIGDRFIQAFEVEGDGSATANAGGFFSEGIFPFDLQAAPVSPIGIGQVVTESIGSDEPFDLYEFNAVAGQIVSIRMERTSGTLDTKVFLLNANNVTLAENDDIDPNLVIGNASVPTNSLINAFTIPVDGTYRIVATRFGTQYGGTVGTYRLSISGS